MKLLNKERRIRILGFDDIWFMIIGILILSFVTAYLFNSSLFHYPFYVAVINWSISLFFTIFNWLFMRTVLMNLRVRFPLFKDNAKRIAILFLVLVVSVIIIDIIGNVLLIFAYGVEYNPLSRTRVLLPVVVISTMVQAIYEAIYHYVRLKKSVREEEQAKQMVVQAQLDALRNQAQPHFLFNTLNTLRDIIDQNSKAEAKEFVDKIADVYRFILEAGNSDLIRLRDELKFAKSYIHIQKERFGDNLKVNWNISDVFLDMMIIPMSLQLLLENAIKHNVISKSKPLTVDVNIKDGHLIVANKIQPKSSQLPSTRVGLINIEKRYHLISELSPKIDNDGIHFVVGLPLLNSADQKKSYASIDY